MRFSRRLQRGLVATGLLAAVALGGVSLGGDVEAAEQAPMTVTYGKPTTATYGPLVVANPSNQLADPVPADCTLLPTPVVTLCDVIPVKVVLPPDYDDNSSYAYTTVTLAWPDDPLGAGANDIDLYMYDAAGEALSSSATAGNPEIAKTEAREFFIVANNFSGVQTEYAIKLEITIDTIEKPFELPEPERPNSGFGLPTGSPLIDAGPGAGEIALPDGGIVPDLSNTPAGGAPLGKIDLVPAPAQTVDVDFEAAQREIEEAERALAASTAEKGTEVSAGVWFWLVLLPIAAVASAGTWLVRRRPATLKR